MKKFLSFLASRPFLAGAIVVVLALVVWFIGPLIAFGGLVPLAGVGIRVFVTALMLTAVLLWLAEWSISPAVVGLVCVLIAYASPLLTFGRVQPFAPLLTRTIVIAVVLAMFLAYWIFRLLQKMRENERFLKTLLEFGTSKEPSPAADALKKVQASTSAALTQLKAMRTGARGIGRLLQGKRYLYELPWYVTLGPQNSGKTSALLLSGLSFPAGDQVHQVARSLTDGTAHVDWWLTNDAVLIDTAGHYTRHGVRTAEPAADTTDRATPQGAGGAAPQSEKDESAVELGEKTASAGAAATSSKTDKNRVPPETQRFQHDQAEWFGLLGMLRRVRPRAPVNGALLTIDVARLTSMGEHTRIAEAAALRARLTELRQELGIRFPVYLVITKMDRLSGFTDYFGSLTAEARAQSWGFTLPDGKETLTRDSIRSQCRDELRLLTLRLTDGVNNRLQDEYDTERRCKLTALGEEFAALASPLTDLIERIFLESRYDETQLHTTLRGVYFASATQAGPEIVVERFSVAQRVADAMGHTAEHLRTLQTGNQSYFLHDLFTKVVFPEAHLVRANLRWEYRFRMLRVLGHALALLIFVWLALGMHISAGNNHAYLDAIAHKAQALASQVTNLYTEPRADAVPQTLTDARLLANHPGLDLSAPDSSYRFGLYTGYDIEARERRTYDALEDHLLLPRIVQRMETVLAESVAKKDVNETYDALRVYLMLNDRAKYNAAAVKEWVLEDWATNDSAAMFGGRAAMIAHVEQLFSGERVVQSPLLRNDALIRQARTFLDGSNAPQRLYERAKASMVKASPDEFTLLRAVGPQAGTVFTRASGAPLSRGVPGLFTFDGYRNVFDKRLPEFVQAARDDDAWVMGRSYLNGAQKKTAEIVNAAGGADDPLTEAIRRQYLDEYARQWDAFLGDIRTVTGTSLAFNLQVLGSLAAPDSPLARLARAAAHETTLTGPVDATDGSFLQKATTQLGAKANASLGIRPEERLERELVDGHFAALREVVTGSAEAQTAQPTAPQDKTGLDGVANLLNDYYTTLTVADNALQNNSMPPASDTAAKLKMTANTMPVPFQAVLLDLATQGSREVNQGIGQLLSRQMQAVVGDTCRLTVEGNYPFAVDSKRDVSIDDFTRMFAQGGVIDDFFAKTLAPFVDTSARPWRYRTLPGATEPVQGPDLEPFEHAKAIRDTFFADPGQKQLSWKADIRVPELDPTITGLMIDIDGQTTLYQHGPVAPFPVAWPGPRGGVHTEITANPRIRPDTSTIVTDGPWALMRLLQGGHAVETATPGRTRVAFDFDGRKAVLDVSGMSSVANPLTGDVLTTFHCPSSMPMFNLVDTGPPPGLPPVVH